MSVVTKEEIELEVGGVEEGDDIGFMGVRDFRLAVEAAERVAALVEERLKELVCPKCGLLTTLSKDGMDFCADHGFQDPTTRAQFEADREVK